MYEFILFMAIMSKPPEPPVYECVRWTWTGDVYNRKVVCLQWREKDCSNRLHKTACRLGT